MYTIDLSGKTALVFGIANQRSIAWSITKSLHDAGASIIAAYQNDRVKPSVDKLTSELDRISTVECDVSDDRNVEKTFDLIKEQTDRLDMLQDTLWKDMEQYKTPEKFYKEKGDADGSE